MGGRAAHAPVLSIDTSAHASANGASSWVYRNSILRT
jgi:hypothetical protein